MKKRALLSLLLALALLAGCAPAAEVPASAPLPPAAASPAPTPEPTPAPTPEPVDFREFLDGVNAARKALLEETAPLDLSPYTPDFHEQNQTFTEAEMERLTTEHGPEENLTKDGLLADADTFFLLLQTTYGAYYYFGGDDVFFPIRDAVREELAAMEDPTVQDLNDVLYRRLYPAINDGHFRIGDYAINEAHQQYMYYVPGVYLDSLDGVENPDYLKPTIGPDGRICWWYAAISRDGGDLPSALDGHTLAWRRAGRLSQNRKALAFDESEWEGVPILISRRMSASWVNGSRDPDDLKALERLASCGGEYAGSPLLIFDVRMNGGGLDEYGYRWFQGWSGGKGECRGATVFRCSQLFLRHHTFISPEHIGTYCPSPFYPFGSSTGAWVERSGPAFVLQDKGTASAGEAVVLRFHVAADTITVGGPTCGCLLTGNNIDLYLPHSGLHCGMGTGLISNETNENRDGVGYLPDLWVEPSTALDAVKRLIDYYGLNSEG